MSDFTFGFSTPFEVSYPPSPSSVPCWKFWMFPVCRSGLVAMTAILKWQAFVRSARRWRLTWLNSYVWCGSLKAGTKIPYTWLTWLKNSENTFPLKFHVRNLQTSWFPFFGIFYNLGTESYKMGPGSGSSYAWFFVDPCKLAWNFHGFP